MSRKHDLVEAMALAFEREAGWVNPTLTRRGMCAAWLVVERYAKATASPPEEGGPCPQPGCNGFLAFKPVEGCTCFVSPPCGACLENPLRCFVCDELAGEELP